MRVTANYHTHTKRCRHAVGEDREYVEAAIAAGFEILGFADHTPYPTGTGFKSGMRILCEDADGYFQSISDLREEYKNDIKIYIGVEAEYFPEHFDKLLEFMKPYPLDYMILGHHFVPDEQFGMYVGAPFKDKKIIEEYGENVVAGIRTGKFSYVAHPDLPNYVGKNKDAVREETFHKICKAAKEYNVPLEINMLGHVRKSQYPSDQLLKIAAQYGNDMIIGMDVHNPEHFWSEPALEECVAMAQKYGLNLLSKLDLDGNGEKFN